MTYRSVFLFLALAGGSFGLYGQQQDAVSLISQDDASFQNLSRLTLPKGYETMPLPAQKDNTLGTYFSGIYSQQVWNCNQASSIWTMFTYEINYLRGLNSSMTQNQYSPMAVYNLLNYGNGSIGVSYFDSWNQIKANGIPGNTDFPANSQNSQFWMTGYDKYYRGMKNRIDEVFAIDVGNPEGLLTLKHWLNDHLGESHVGGLANFQIGSGNMIIPRIPLEKGLEAEGEFIVVRYDPNVGHAMTFAGWNDSVRFDFNDDGRYTNHLDINGDFVVDMKDWEIGAMLVVNSWSQGWGNGGKVWVMYRVLAESTQNGGIWNNAAMVVKPKKTYDPLLTVKAKIRYNQRNRLKIQVGVSADLNATAPERVMDFPCFNFQGDTLPMQGFSGPNSDLIEIGLDITPLMNYIPASGQARIFLEVIQKSPNSIAAGRIERFSVMDYTNGVREFFNTEGMVNIGSNAVTRLPATITSRVNRPQITTDELPVAGVGIEYHYQLEAGGSAGPYRFANPGNQYVETPNTPVIGFSGGTDVFPIPDITARVMDLPFLFPFYGESFNQITVLKDGGFVMGQSLVKYPYVIDSRLRFYQNQGVFPFLSHLYYPASGNKVTLEASSGEVIIRWNASTDPQGSQTVEFAAGILPDGTIRLYYGNMNVTPDIAWISGVSSGNNLDYYLMNHNNTSLAKHSAFSLGLQSWPSWLSLSGSGELHGIPDQPGVSALFLRVTDWSGITSNKELFIQVNKSSGLDPVIDPKAVPRIWPNPVSDGFWLESDFPRPGTLTISIFNLKGQKLINRTFRVDTGSNAIHFTGMEALSAGLYLYELSGVINYRGKLIRKD